MSAAFGEEKKDFSTARAARKAQNICALERYRRTGEKRYIACRLRELSELDEFVRGRGEKERAKLAGDIAEFLEEALAQDGAKLADIFFEFLEAHEMLKEKMYAGVLEKLREAYLALLDGGVKSYKIGNEELTRLDLVSLQKRIEEAEKKVDELEALLNGGASGRAYAVVPMDW